MNDFALVQLIWIKRLVNETSRINTLIECKKLSQNDLNRYKSLISSIDDFSAFVINSQNWGDNKSISKIVDEVEMVLFQHLYEQMDAFEDEEVHLDLSRDDEVNLRFNSPFIEDKSFAVIDEDGFKSNDDSRPFSMPILEGDILPDSDRLDFIGGNIDYSSLSEDNQNNSIDSIFDMDVGESCEMSLEEFISLISESPENFSFALNPEACGDVFSEDYKVSLEEFIANVIYSSSKDKSNFDL